MKVRPVAFYFPNRYEEIGIILVTKLKTLPSSSRISMIAINIRGCSKNKVTIGVGKILKKRNRIWILQVWILRITDMMAYSREGRVTKCLAKLHMGRLFSLIVIENGQNFGYEITLGLNAAKNTHALYQKMLQIKVLRIQFRTKNSVGAYVYLPQEWS